MQPLRLNFELISSKVPQEVFLGYTPHDDIVRLHKNDMLNKHIYVIGQTGSGKSKTLILLLQQILSNNFARVIFIDPLGAVWNEIFSWYSYLAMEYYKMGESRFNWFVETVLPNVLFWDLSDQNHNIRWNMMSPFPGESIGDLIQFQIKLWDHLLSAGKESDEGGLEIQRQRRANIVALMAIFAATQTPFGQARDFIYSRDFRDNLLRQAEERSNLQEVRDAGNHFRFLINEFQGKWAEKIVSLETGIAPLFESRVLRNLLCTSENNVNFNEILNSKSLFIKVPASDLPAKKILLRTLYSIFFHLAEKRPKDSSDNVVYLGSDESSLVFDSTYAEMVTRIRNYNVLLISCHQSLKQMLSEDRIRMAQVIHGQSGIRIYFKNDYDECEKTVDDEFILTSRLPKDLEITYTITRSAGEGATQGSSESTSREKSTGTGRSFQEGLQETHNKSYSVTDALGLTEGIQNQWSEEETFGETKRWQIGDAFTYSETKGLQKIQSVADGITFLLGEGKSMLKILTEGGSVTFSETEGQAETRSESSGSSSGLGSSDSYSYNKGAGISVQHSNSGGTESITVVEGNIVPIGRPASDSESETINNYKNISISSNKQRNYALQQARGIARALSKVSGRAESKLYTTGNSQGISTQESLALLKSFSEGVAASKQYAEAIQRSLGHGKSLSRGKGFGHSISESTSRSAQRAIQQAQGITLGIMRNLGVNINETLGEKFSQGLQYSLSINTSISFSISYKLVYYTMQEERRHYAQMLRSLPPRTFYLSIGNERNPIKVITGNCFELPHIFGDYDFLKILTRYYRNFPNDGGKCEIFPGFFPDNIIIEEPKIYISLPDDFNHIFPL